MIYRDFKIDRLVTGIHLADAAFSPTSIEYVVSETVGGFHWQVIGSTQTRSMAKEMIDRVADVRLALCRVIDGDLSMVLESAA